MTYTEKGISTFPRYLYLNIYAFLLLFLGVGAALIPCYKVLNINIIGGIGLIAVQVIATIVCLKNSYKIFHSWQDKKRKYRILMERNATDLHPETFKTFLWAPCGILLVKLVLKDLGRSKEYKELRKTRPPFKEFLDLSCGRQKTVVYINDKMYAPNDGHN